MKKNKRRGKSPVSTVCSTLGTFLLIILIIGCIPLTIPKLFGYEIFTVISGSMEPEIPVGSLVYIKGMDPQYVQENEVIAFYGGKDTNAIITHRVIENRVIMGEFITKGDANQTNDMNPVRYEDFIGYVALAIPKVGMFAQALTSQMGKIAAVSMIGLAMVFHLLASLFDKKT